MPKAYSYLRFSTPEQAAGDSLRRQLAAARRYADEHGLDLDDSLRDEGVSAFRGSNRSGDAALGRFLARVESGDVAPGSYLLVESLDRLSRQAARKALRTLEEIIDAGITVVTLSDGAVYTAQALDDDPLLLMRALLVMTRSNEESKTKSNRVAAAWATKRQDAAASGAPMTSWCPAWLRVEGDVRRRQARYVEIPERVAVVREIFRWSADEGLGTDAIARRLNERQEPTWGRGKRQGSHWHDSYVGKLLRGRAVLGDMERADGSVITGIYPPVIDDDLWHRAQAARVGRRTDHGGRKSVDVGNLFSGVARCAHCGGGMVIVRKGSRSSGPALQCGRSRYRAGCDNTRPIFYPRLETRALIGIAFAVDAAERERLADDGSAASRLRDAVVAATARVAELDARREAAAEAVEAGSSSLVPRLIALEKELSDARRALSEAVSAERAHVGGDSPRDLAMLLRQRAEGPEARARLARAVRRLVTSMTCDRDGNVRFDVVGGGRFEGLAMPAHGEPRWNPGRLTSRDGRRRRDDPALVAAHAGGPETPTKPKPVVKRVIRSAPRPGMRTAFGRGSDT